MSQALNRGSTARGRRSTQSLRNAPRASGWAFTAPRRSSASWRSSPSVLACLMTLLLRSTNSQVRTAVATHVESREGDADVVAQSAGVIKQDIQAMNAAIADLQTLSAGSAYDANKQRADHSHVVVDSLRTQLKVSIERECCASCSVQLSRSVNPSGSKAPTRRAAWAGYNEDVQGRHDAPGRKPERQ